MKEEAVKKEFEVYMLNGIIYGIYGQNVVIDLELMQRIIKARLELSQGKRYPLFADARGVKYWTLEARKYASSPEGNKDDAAYAILINSNIIKTIVNWAIKFYPTKGAPQRIFTDKDKALQWLEQFKK